MLFNEHIKIKLQGIGELVMSKFYFDGKEVEKIHNRFNKPNYFLAQMWKFLLIHKVTYYYV